MTLRLILAAMLFAAPAPAVARILDYIRSNRDGSEAERILVYMPQSDRVEVLKMRARCTNAAYVTAQIDVRNGYATQLSAGRLKPNARRETFGTLDYAPSRRQISVNIMVGRQTITDSIAIAPGPWHLYDFDLTSLSAVRAAAPNAKSTFAFSLPLVWNGDAPLLRDLGAATAHFVRTEKHRGRQTHRFEVSGSSGKFVGGPLWLDAKHGYVVAARFGTPNHAEYRDFSLELQREHKGGRRTWTRLLTAHFDGCP